MDFQIVTGPEPWLQRLQAVYTNVIECAAMQFEGIQACSWCLPRSPGQPLDDRGRRCRSEFIDGGAKRSRLPPPTRILRSQRSRFRVPFRPWGRLVSDAHAEKNDAGRTSRRPRRLRTTAERACIPLSSCPCDLPAGWASTDASFSSLQVRMPDAAHRRALPDSHQLPIDERGNGARRTMHVRRDRPSRPAW